MVYHERTSKRVSNVRVSRRKPLLQEWFCHIWGKRLALKPLDLNADFPNLAILQTKKPPDWEAFLFLSCEKNIFQNFKAPSTTPYMLNHRFWLFFRWTAVGFNVIRMVLS